MRMARTIVPKPLSVKPWRSMTWVGNVVFLLELVCLVLSVLAFFFFFTKMPLPDNFIIFSWLKPLEKIWSCAGMAKVGQTVGLTGIAFAWLISSAGQEIANVSMRELVKWAYPETYFCYFYTYFPMLIMLIYTGTVEDSTEQSSSAVCASFFASVGALALLAYTLRVSYVLLLSPEKRRHIVLGFYIAKAAGDEKYRLINRCACCWQAVKNCYRHIGTGHGDTSGKFAEEMDSPVRGLTHSNRKEQQRDAETAMEQQLVQQQRMLWCRKGVQVASMIEVRYYPLYAGELAMLWHQNCAGLKTRIEALFADLLQEQDCEDTDLMSLVGELATAWMTLLRTQRNRIDQTVAVRYILSARLWDETESIFLCVALVDAIFRCVEEDEMSSQEALSLFRRLQSENASNSPPIEARQSQYLLCAFDMYLAAMLILTLDSATEEKTTGKTGREVDEKDMAMKRTFEEWRKARTEYKYLKVLPETPVDASGYNLLTQIVKNGDINKDTESELVALAEDRIQLARDLNRSTISDADLVQIDWLLRELLPAIPKTNVPNAEKEASDIKESEVVKLILNYLLRVRGGFDALIKTREKEAREPEMVMLCAEMAFRQSQRIPYVNWQRAVNKRLLGDSNAASAMAQFLPRLWHRELCLRVW